eukprot:gnl/Spiro4/13045_TR6918_c0_g1_i1.p1 gnl/Spiro4/13045_TR6918_c0_g1~~gnl/Spiro4/13045_TR6918_c0_g1_i1.p1  ORF type:complete len:438 (+),score=102.33 gnl/Spiro4/13045_TR6918_c0_g1_i1:63-1316(+)
MINNLGKLPLSHFLQRLAVAAKSLPTVRPARLNRVRQQLKNHGYAACILYDPINIRYATDARNMQLYHMRNAVRYLLVPAEGEVTLFDSVYGHEGVIQPGIVGVTVDRINDAITVAFNSAGSHLDKNVGLWAKQIDSFLKPYTKTNRKVALEAGNPLCSLALRDMGYELFDAQRPIELARAVKVPGELDLIRASIEVVAGGVFKMRDALKPGMTENELWSLLHQHVIAADGEYIETRLCNSGVQSNPWLKECGNKVIQAGELVALDTDAVGPFGYYVDFSRTFVCPGKPPTPKQKELYRLAVEQVDYNKSLIRPGISFSEFASKAWQIPPRFHKNRYWCMTHGVGMSGEYPLIYYRDDQRSRGYDGVIEENMTLCCESYMGEEGGCEGVKFEEHLLVTKDGVETLSSVFPREDILLN